MFVSVYNSVSELLTCVLLPKPVPPGLEIFNKNVLVMIWVFWFYFTLNTVPTCCSECSISISKQRATIKIIATHHQKKTKIEAHPHYSSNYACFISADSSAKGKTSERKDITALCQKPEWAPELKAHIKFYCCIIHDKICQMLSLRSSCCSDPKSSLNKCIRI